MPKQLRQIRRVTHSDRGGFTLIELMIVIAIIATLMGLSFAVFFGLTDQAEEEATNTTIQKVNRLLEQRIEAFDRAFRGARRQSSIAATRGLLASKNIFGVREEVIEILAKKATFRFEFPQRYADAVIGSPDADGNTFPDVDNDNNGLLDAIERTIAGPAARQQLIAEGNASPTLAEISTRMNQNWANHVPATESSELLYFFLISSGSFGASSVDADRFTADEVKDTDQDGLPEFVDAWGQPLRFYRWPTRLIDTNPPQWFVDGTGAEPVLTDPSDPTDVLTVVDTDDDGIPDATVGVREATANERAVAGMLMKGLSPGPSVLPSGALPRDLLLTDPDDPVGRLYSELERFNGLNSTPNFALEFNEVNYHTPETFHSPLIVSAGPDEDLGLFEPNDTVNLGNLARYQISASPTAAEIADLIDRISDNITNRNRRAGGRK